MGVAKRVGATIGAFTALLVATTANGDGDCVKGYRDITEAERGTMNAVLETAKKAIPAPPAGWVLRGDDSVSLATTICIDQEAGPWTYELMRYYQRVDDQEARNKILEKAATDLAAQMAAKQPRLDALMAKIQAQSQEAAAAAQSGDYTRIESINKEMQKTSEEYQKVVEEGGTTAKMNAAAAEASRDQEMSVVVRVNSGFEFPSPEAQRLPPPSGAQSAYRWSEKRGSVQEAHALVLLGQWQPSSEGGLQAKLSPNAAAPAAQAISVRVVTDESRLSPTLDATDFNALASTLVK